jgi:glutamate racemase
VLGTARTIEDPYIMDLAARYGGDCGVSRIAAADLVELVERGGPAMADGETRRRAVSPYVEAFRREGADGIVLGCTHFLLLLEDFKAAAGPDIRLYDSVEGVSRRAEALLDGGGSPATAGSPGGGGPQEASLRRREGGLRRPGDAAAPERLLVLTGRDAPAQVWRDRAAAFGLSLRILGG